MRSWRKALLGRTVVTLAVVAAIAIPLGAQTTPNVPSALTWLASQQQPNGSWGTIPELAPRDTARVLIAQTLQKSTSPTVGAGYAWLSSQRGIASNQFLAEQARALTLGKLDAAPSLTQLLSQRAGNDFGGFADHTGNSYDTALALQALVVNEAAYQTQIATAVTQLMTRQNADGGWGIDAGFDSNPVLTAEVLAALSLPSQQKPPQIVITAAQSYLAARIQPNGSVGGNVLETATAFRALALSGYPLSNTSAATFAWLASQQGAGGPAGSWGGDVYVTARVLEALTANKPNLLIAEGDVIPAKTTVTDGETLTVTVKITNIGALHSPATTTRLFVTDSKGRQLDEDPVKSLVPGESVTVTHSFTVTSMQGSQSLYALVDPNNAIEELRDDDNARTASIVVRGKPDLQVYSSDISTVPARVQPDQEATISVTLRNNGEGDASNVTYAIYDVMGSSEKLITKTTLSSIASNSSQVVTHQYTFTMGSHSLKVVLDPDTQIAESSETNNSATRSFAVSPVANIDVRVVSVTADPPIAGANETVTVRAVIENTGNQPVTTKLGFLDGTPGAGGLYFNVQDISLDAQTSTEMEVEYTTRATTRVIYAYVDPQNILSEVDEANNKGFATLTDQYIDLSITREGVVLPRTTLNQNQQLQMRAVIRNHGVLAAENVKVEIYDDLPSVGGTKVVDTTITVPAGGKVVVPAQWTMRAGQRFATVIVNPSQSPEEIDYDNNRVTKYYVVNGSGGGVTIAGGSRSSVLDLTGLVVDPVNLTMSGLVKVLVSGNVGTAFGVTLFDDLDGDFAYNPDVDTLLGSALGQPNFSQQWVQIPVQGTIRYSPGHPILYFDSGNSLSETGETNNFFDLYQNCEGAIVRSPEPFIKWQSTLKSSRLSPVARLADSNGDDRVDENDMPSVVLTINGSVAVVRGDTGQVIWSRSPDSSGAQIAPVIADVDNDGTPEIIAHASNTVNHKLICYRADGSTKWVSPDLPMDPEWDFALSFTSAVFPYLGMPAAADLDGDNKPEVIVGRTALNGADGTIKWIGTGGSGRVWDNSGYPFNYFSSQPEIEAPIAVNLDTNADLEVVAGHTAYRANGSILWHRGDLPDGFTTPVWLPNESTPKIVLVNTGKVWLLNGTNGATVWGPMSLPGGAIHGGAATVFMDGNTGPWIGVGSDFKYTVFNAVTGAQQWSVDSVANPAHARARTANSATAFDFGQGMTLVYGTTDRLVIYDATNGVVLQELPIAMNANVPGAPVVADVDDDGHADVVVPDIVKGVAVLSNKSWNGAPSIFNQASYHVVNVVNEMAKIPARETQTTFSRTHYRNNTPIAPPTTVPRANLVAGYLRADTTRYPVSTKLTVRVGNNGWTSTNPVNVSFFRAASPTPEFLGSVQAEPIPAGGYQDVVFNVPNPTLGTATYFAKADDLGPSEGDGTADAGKIPECNETDNAATQLAVTISADVAIDASTVAVSDTRPQPGARLDLIAGAAITGSVDASALKAQFFLGNPASGGSAISGLLPVILAGSGTSRTASATFSWTLDVPDGEYTIYAVFDPANAIAEKNETNNSGSVTFTVSTTPTADLATNQAFFLVSDPQPRPTDTIQLAASAHVSGSLNEAAVTAQFFLGTPGSGTPLSGVIPATIVADRGFRTATATFDWTVDAPEGTHSIYAVFDPENAIEEVDETNNLTSSSVVVTTPQIIRSLNGTITLSPPSAEAGTPVSVQILVQNNGNVPLEDVVLKYSVSGGAGTAFTGTKTIDELPKNDIANIEFGSFVPSSNGIYTVTVTAEDPEITLGATPKTIKIAPFATAELTAVPKRVPVSLPLVQLFTKITRGNTIVVADDPLVPLVRNVIQKGLNWQGPQLNAHIQGCYKCHVESQGMVSFEASRLVSGVTINETVARRLFTNTTATQQSNGIHDGSWPRTTNVLGAWSLSYWHDNEEARPYFVRSLDGLLTRQNTSGSNAGAWECDHCDISYGSREAMTMMSMIALARGYELTQDPRYLASLNKAVAWALNYPYTNARTSGPEYAARISIGLSSALPVLEDPSLKTSVKGRVDTIAGFLQSLQNPDGTFGAQTSPINPIVRTAQCLYALALAGVPGDNPGLRQAIVWLMNEQQPAGGWREDNSGSQVTWIDESTWAMIALPAAFLRLGQFDVDFEVFIPSDTDLVSSSVPPASTRSVSGGKQVEWHFKDVTEAGYDLFFNVRLNGIQNEETRPATGPAKISYESPNGGDLVTRNVAVPSVTAYAPLTLAIDTDQEVYGPNSTVTITEEIENVGTSNDGVTTGVVIRDANGSTVATVVSNDPVTGLPPVPFPGWHYSVPVSVPVTVNATNRIITFDINFESILTSLGATGTFDSNSIRVSADSAPSKELHYSWVPSATNDALGKMVVTIPDSIQAPSTLALHVFFDTTDNAFKPVSMFDRGSSGGQTGQGFVAKYYHVNTSLTPSSALMPEQVVWNGPPIATVQHTTTNIGSARPAGVPGDFWGVDWTGVLYAPVTGTYRFATSSDDGSWLEIDGQMVVNNGGAHATREISATVVLTEGFHTFKVRMYEWGGGEWLTMRWAPPGQSLGFLTASSLYPSTPANTGSSPTVIGAGVILPAGKITKTYTWNTGSTASAPYTAVGSLRQFGSFLGNASAPFSISPASELRGSISTDKPAYDAHDTVRVRGSVEYANGNTTLTNLTATLSVLDPDGVVLASGTTPIASLVAGQNVPVNLDWPAGTSPAGTYTARLVVTDAANTPLSSTSVPFDIRPTAQTGKGVSGTISTVESVYQGDPLPISVTVTNTGNSDLTDAPFAVHIIDPATGEAVATLPFTASIAEAATHDGSLSHLTTGMAVKTYEAWLVSMITGAAKPLATTTFEVKPPPLKLELSFGGPARVIVWADCASGNSNQPCTPVAPPFLTKTLTDAGIPWTVVGTQTAFISAVRTGAYDAAVLYQVGAYEAKIATELLETIRGGLGIIHIKNQPNADPKLLPALGVAFRGKINASSTLLDVLPTSFTNVGQLTLNGEAVNIELQNGAIAVANIAATQAPAIALNQYGQGRVVTVPFNTEKTPTADVAQFLLSAVHYVARADSFDARQVIPIDFKVTPPPNVPSNLTIAARLPEGMSVVYAMPPLTSTENELSWNVTSDGTEFHLYLWVRLPEDAGTYTVTGTAAFQGQMPVVIKTIDVEVTADRVAMETALAADLAALSASAPAKDAKAIGDATAKLNAIRNAPATDSAVLQVERVLALINSLSSVSVDTAAARRDADRILLYWQSRI